MFNKNEASMKKSIKNLILGVVLSVSVITPVYSGVVSNFLAQEASKKLGESFNKKSNPQNNYAQNGRQQRAGEGKGACPQHYPFGVPVVNANVEKVERRSFFLCEQNYAVQYDTSTKNPIWVSEVLIGSQQKSTFVERVDNFMQNPKVPQPAQANLGDFRNSGFDRGHMAPAADMLNEKAMEESFYLTNMVPQVGPNMNRGIWAELEGIVRKWSVQRGKVIVVSGPIFDVNTKTIGSSEVWVPSYLYKIVLDPNTGDSIGFIMPNRQIITRKTKSLDNGNILYPQTTASYAENCSRVCTLDNFIVPVAKIEDLLDIDFFPTVDIPSKAQKSQMWHIVN